VVIYSFDITDLLSIDQFPNVVITVPELTSVYLTQTKNYMLNLNCLSDKSNFWPHFTIWVQGRAPPPLKIIISVNDINICFGDIWTTVWLRMSCISHTNTCYALRYTLMREYVILCGGHIGFQDGLLLNSDYNNDYVIIRHILPHEYFPFRAYKCRIVCWIRNCSIIFELSSQFEFKEGHPSKMKMKRGQKWLCETSRSEFSI